ncbi:MAG: hypothetical protein KC621_03525 [Myxococcales bacterium]|nr:hypothetical protein [Myxococcales bacterium]
MSRAPSSKPTGYKIEGADRGYSEAGYGPNTDTDAHMTPPPHARSKAPTDMRAQGPSGKMTPIPDIRRVARKPADVERERPREMPRWLFPAIAVVIFVAFMGGGVFLLVSALLVERIVDGPAQPEVIEDIDGIPVRQGFGDRR